LHALSREEKQLMKPLERRHLLASAAGLAAFACSRRVWAEGVIRVGTLRYGSFSWELAVIRRHGLDRAAGIGLDLHELASSPAAQVALQAGSVDLIVQDWLWVARERAEGADWSFVPFSSALGGSRSPLTALPDLRGRRLGVAGSAIDKSWLILRAYAQRRFGLDLAQAAEPHFAPPALLAEELRAGRIDAALTFWPFVARAESEGMRRLLDMTEAVRGLGLSPDLAFVGYVFSARWAEAHAPLVTGFFRAARQAQAILAQDDHEWEEIAPLTRAQSPDELLRLRDAYRAGIPRPLPVAEEEKAASALFQILFEIGGPALVGAARAIPRGTFWDEGAT
jgi:NitT/TauT family transport system substrate-binding protein